MPDASGTVYVVLSVENLIVDRLKTSDNESINVGPSFDIIRGGVYRAADFRVWKTRGLGLPPTDGFSLNPLYFFLV